MEGLTLAVILDTRKPLADGNYTVKLRITFNRERQYYPTKYRMSKEEFAKTQVKTIRVREDKELKAKFDAIENRAHEVIGKLKAFSFYEFEKRYKNSSLDNNVFPFFDRRIAQLKLEERVGTADSYNSARNSLLSFVKKETPTTHNKGLTLEQIAQKKIDQQNTPVIPFEAISVPFLKDYEKWMLKNGRSKTTIGMYLRPLRALFNEAVVDGVVKEEYYPFTKRKFQIPTGQNIKKAIDLSEIKKIISYPSEIPNEIWARDIWIFSYLCNGINLKDIALLRYKQINGNTVTFIRSKTLNTKKENLAPIQVTLNKDGQRIVGEIIESWGNKPALPNKYVFPIFTEGLTPEQELRVKREAIKKINIYIRQLSAKAGVGSDITTYVARHSFATVLTLAGVSTAFISAALGHSTEKTTKNYQDTLPGLATSQIGDFLTNFD